MKVKLRRLDRMADYVLALDKDQFAVQYPGFYLVPMGLISAEEDVVDTSSANAATNEHPEQTLSLHFDNPRQCMGQPHPLAGQLFQFTGPASHQLVLGRGQHCDVHVPDESVSEEHCQLQVVPEGLVIVDLGSTNGTCINSRRLLRDEVELLANGDMLRVGRYSFQLLSATSLYSTLALIRAFDAPE